MLRRIYKSKVIPVTEEQLIQACLREDRKAQKVLFDRYSAKMLGVCMRYIKSKPEAEDVLVEGMYKVLTKLDSYKGKGSFEGWIRRIMVNQSLMFLRKRNELRYAQEIDNVELLDHADANALLYEQDLLKMLDRLPTGYRTVFNLYVIEGYKHREIAEKLGISINTSKSQLILAKKRLREILSKNQYPDVG